MAQFSCRVGYEDLKSGFSLIVNEVCEGSLQALALASMAVLAYLSMDTAITFEAHADQPRDIYMHIKSNTDSDVSMIVAIEEIEAVNPE